MNWLVRIFRRGSAHVDLVREINAHLAERVDDLVEAGMSEADAQRQAALEFGNRARCVEDSRGVWQTRWVEAMAQDARFALRALRRAPGFCVTTILILAFGIGLVTALFAVFNASVLRPWPVADPGSIALISGRPPAGREYGLLSNVEFRYFREHARSFTHLASSIRGGGPIASEDGSAIANVQHNYVTANYFDALGVGMAAGRDFLPEEEDYRAPRPVAIISERLWREYFAGDPAIVGGSVRIRDQMRTVVGVAAHGFSDVAGSIRIDVWLPLPTLAMAFSAAPDSKQLAQFDDPRQGGARVFGRLAPGITRRSAQAELDVLSRQFRTVAGMAAPGIVLTDTRPISSDTTGVRRQLPVLAMMFVALLLVMLLACANVGNLNLARAMSRQREIAIRLSLGASPFRVARQLVAESLVLSIIAGAVAVCLVVAVPRLLLGLASPLNRPDYVAPDLLVFSFAFGLSVFAGVFSGLAPALRMTRPRLTTSTLDKNESGPSVGRLRTSLLASQIALTMVLLVGAGLLTRAITHAMSLDPGFAVNETQLLALHPNANTPPVAPRVIHDALTPAGLTGVASSTFPPITTSRADVAMRRPEQGREMNRLLLLRPVSANYFELLGIPMIVGRTFAEGSGRREIVLSESAAKRFWPDENPIGKLLVRGDGEKQEESYEVVGVIADIATTTLTTSEPVLYWPVDHIRFLLLRDSSAVTLERMRRVVQGAAPGIDVSSRPLRDDLRESLRDLVMGSRLAWTLGLLALGLATIGAFGVFAYVVEERRREIGIRMALGARDAEVVRVILGAAMPPILLGLIAGLVLSVSGAQLMRSALYGMSPFDPVAYFQIAVIMIAAAVAATWLPALRATRVAPAVTLRGD
jgi:predicted permease